MYMYNVGTGGTAFLQGYDIMCIASKASKLQNNLKQKI